MTLSKEHLAWALCSIMDGMKEHEIREITGLPPETCEAIWSVYVQSVQTLDQQPKPKSLVEEALDAWDRLRNETWCQEIDFDLDQVRRALERLQELEGT